MMLKLLKESQKFMIQESKFSIQKLKVFPPCALIKQEMISWSFHLKRVVLESFQ